MSSFILLPDGSKCWSGVSCRKHGGNHVLTTEVANTLATWGVSEAVDQVAGKLLPAERSVRRGINGDTGVSSLTEYLSECADVRSNEVLDEDDWSVLESYTYSAYSDVNRYLREDWKQSVKDTAARIDDPVKRERYLERELGYFKRHNAERVAKMDDAFRKLEVNYEGYKKTRVVYRSIDVKTVNTGADMDSFVEERYPVGGTVVEPGYLSTSVDSDIVLYRSSRSPRQCLVFEIVAKDGVVLHDPEDDKLRGVQSIEREVLLNRNKTFKVAKVTKATYERSYPEDSDLSFLTRDFPKKKRFTVIQLVEV